MLGHRGCRLAITYPGDHRDAGAGHLRGGHRGGAKKARPSCRRSCPAGRRSAPSSIGSCETHRRGRRSVIADETGGQRRLSGRHDDRAAARRARRADEIAETAEFFSFGTNDLTQTTFGISRDDAARFLGAYTPKASFRADPFVTHRPDGVGELVRDGRRAGRDARPDLKLGICGEHGGDPASIDSARSRARLCLLLAVPRADRPAGGGPGGPQAFRPGNRRTPGHKLSARNFCRALIFSQCRQISRFQRTRCTRRRH